MSELEQKKAGGTQCKSTDKIGRRRRNEYNDFCFFINLDKSRAQGNTIID